MTKQEYIDLVVNAQMVLNVQHADILDNLMIDYQKGIFNKQEYQMEWERLYRESVTKGVEASILFSETLWPVLVS